MSDNPYQAPASPVTGVISGMIEDLKGVAIYQKCIIVCILVQLILFVCLFAVPPEFRLFAQIALLPIGLASTVFIFLLAIKVYGTGVGILLGILALFPCIGLLVLLMVNGKATTILRENGYKVGLMGTRLSEIG